MGDSVVPVLIDGILQPGCRVELFALAVKSVPRSRVVPVVYCGCSPTWLSRWAFSFKVWPIPGFEAVEYGRFALGLYSMVGIFQPGWDGESFSSLSLLSIQASCSKIWVFCVVSVLYGYCSPIW